MVMARMEILQPPSAPLPLGPYCPMIKVGQMIWGSALAGVEPHTGHLAGTTTYSQATAALQLIARMLGEVGSGLNNLVSVTVFLKDITGFSELNAAFQEQCGEHQPTRSVVAVVDLPKPYALLTMNFVALARD
jgi:2-iminobutanoate/2-iminopropanoate deaminase